MATEFVSLAIICLIAALAPLIARIIPRQVVPETVLLILAGAILGPNMLGFIESGLESISLLSELGCAFLFLLAGYEIDPRSLSGTDGKHGLATWGVTFAIAIVFTAVLPEIGNGPTAALAMALLLTTTALGTLMPIIKDRGLMGTREGDLVISYGTWGELGPVLAVALLLSSRSTWQTALILLAFLAICIWMGVAGSKARRGGSRIYQFLESKADTNSQTFVRVTVLILVALVAFSAIFDLDIVLGAFAAGFVLRFIIPDGHPRLESKLEGIGYGFFIPLFFIVSGCKIDLSAVAAMPLVLVYFILGLILVRCVPIVVSLTMRKSTRDIPMHNRLSVAFYCTTALPLIVAITSISVNNGMMESSIASVLVSAGALTVFLMPFLGQIAYTVADAEPIKAIHEIAEGNEPVRHVLHEHIELERKRAKEYHRQAHQRMTESIDSIGNPEERKEARELAHRHIQERKDLSAKQREEISALYLKYNSELPGEEQRARIFERFLHEEEGRGKDED